MKIGKLIKILRAEDKQRPAVSTELLRDSSFDVISYLRASFAARLAHNLDKSIRRASKPKKKTQKRTNLVARLCPAGKCVGGYCGACIRKYGY